MDELPEAGHGNFSHSSALYEYNKKSTVQCDSVEFFYRYNKRQTLKSPGNDDEAINFSC